MARFESRASQVNPGKIVRGFLILIMILFLGTIGYVVIEGWDVLSAFYMTVITITTVGFGEIRKVSPLGRLFTIGIIFSGMGIIAYLLGLTAQAMVDFQVRSIFGRRKLGLKMKSIKDHYIICGFGRIGKIICRELKSKNIPMVVIDNAPESKEQLENEGIPYINDDATNEDIIIEAGIERAKGLISVVASDADNLFITMTARGLNPEGFILARADLEQTEKKLLRAGANKVVLPYLIGGQKMAHFVTRPAVSDFLDFAIGNREMGLEMGELLVDEKSKLNGLTLVDSGIRQEMDIIIVAVMKKDGTMAFNPSSRTTIEAGDTLIALGKNEEIERLCHILDGK